MKPCKGCKAPTDMLDLFPGDRCLGCYAASEEAFRELESMTPETLAGMWKGVVR